MTSLLFRGSLRLVVDFAHLSSGSRVGYAWGGLRFLLAVSLVVWGKQILSVWASRVVLGGVEIISCWRSLILSKEIRVPSHHPAL